jgi:hypothetical protein
MIEPITGIKIIQIAATTQYPIVSAYEYEFLKGEEAVRERLSGCSIYFILQRPLMYFNNMTMSEGKIYFDIVDTVHEPLHGTIDMVECGLATEGEDLFIDLQYYKKEPDKQPPHNDVAAFKVLKLDGSFVVWETPQKLLYEAIANGLLVSFNGNINDYLEYQVHYIGKSFSQKVWDRLTGHEKMQKILTLEEPIATTNARAPFEITLLMLDIIGFDEGNLTPIYDFAVPKGVTAIPHTLDTEEDFEKFFQPSLQARAPELTSEVEAMLINMFKPAYNDVLFENYPNINKGTRSAGYTHATLLVQKLPVVLKTKYHTQSALDGPVELKATF